MVLSMNIKAGKTPKRKMARLEQLIDITFVGAMMGIVGSVPLLLTAVGRGYYEVMAVIVVVLLIWFLIAWPQIENPPNNDQQTQRPDQSK